jgi:hypothetical protein
MKQPKMGTEEEKVKIIACTVTVLLKLLTFNIVY